MQTQEAAELANEIIVTAIQHQASFIPMHAIGTSERAKEVADNIAAFRARLIEKLKEQP